MLAVDELIDAKRIGAEHKLYPFFNRTSLFWLKSKFNVVFTLNTHQTTVNPLVTRTQSWAKKAKT